MKKYNTLNNITGWLVFLVAAATYMITAEPTTSLWDCGEFIATAYKLEVGHPPGAPFFLMLARVASLFAFGDVSSAALMVNYLSALASAFTVLFLFWTITHITRKFFVKSIEGHNIADLIIVLGSGVVGALAFTFSDSFWFSAVEGEVYALSSLFTAVVFWAILKWENVAHEKYSNRWLILIAYLMGLSIGVHLLNLLAIPAIVMVYYFKKYPVNWKGVLVALGISLALLGFVMYGIISGVVVLASKFELFFVNTLGMPFNSGIVFYFLVVISVLVFGIHYSLRKKKIILNTIISCVIMVLVGYTSYAMIIIRANADTPINENRPDNVFSLLSYLNREQYGDRPLLFGQYYNAPMEDVIEKDPYYFQKEGRYEISHYNYDLKYDSRFTTFFPRMYSPDPAHIMAYKSWSEVVGRQVEVVANNRARMESVPSFSENLKFFIKYQVGHMYMRYFLWNFVGRQNDEQGSGGILKGNWISGISFIDERLIGSQERLPESIKKDPSRNTYYFLPFLLGILGLILLLEQNKRDFTVTVLLFIMTGLAIVVYLNQTPYQPRERDYAYVGSFYVFALWIGIGVAAIYSWIKSEKMKLLRAVATVLLCLLLVPGIMAKENFDDHNRSGRYTAWAYAYNYLNSCAPNAILFTFGDNDTFPLWYLQEVEGIRTDVRVVNTMLLNTEWYIDQMKKKAYNSEPLPISMTPDQYGPGQRGRVYLFDQVKEYIPLKDAVAYAASNDPRTKTIKGYNQEIEHIPGKNFILNVDSLAAIQSGAVKPEDVKKLEKDILFRIEGNHIDKSQLAALDIIANNNWQRPIYFVACNNEATFGLDDYLQLEGFAYRLVPLKPENAPYLECGRVATDIMYNNLMRIFNYGRMEQPDVYMDHFNRRTLNVIKFRNLFAQLAQALIEENKNDSAIKVLDKCLELTPVSKIPDDINSIYIAQAYAMAGEYEKAKNLIERYTVALDEEMNYFFSLRKGLRQLIDYDIRYNLEALNQLASLSGNFDKGFLEKIEMVRNRYQGLYDQQNK